MGNKTSIAVLDSLDQDTEFLVFSYLPLEDILRICKNHKLLRDKILRRYNYKIPLFKDVFTNVYTDLDEDNAILKLQYLLELGFRPTQQEIDEKFRKYSFKIAKLLYKNKCKPSKNILYSIITDRYWKAYNFEMLKFLLQKGYKAPDNIIESLCPDQIPKTKELTEFLRYLVKKGYKKPADNYPYLL